MSNILSRSIAFVAALSLATTNALAGDLRAPVQEPPVAVAHPAAPSAFVAHTPTVAMARPAKPDACQPLGPGWKPLGSTTFCQHSGAGTFTYLSKSFATSDIYLHGSRTVNSVPLIFYEKQNVSGATKYPKLGTVLAYNLDVIGQLPVGPILFHLGLVANPELSFTQDGTSHLGTNFWNPATRHWTLYGGNGGLVHEAWVRFWKFQIGIQPSKFDFLHGGYSVGKSYTPQNTTSSIVYTYRKGNSYSVSVALEDGNPRVQQDGILNYSGWSRTPDLVVQGRIGWGKTIVQLAGAAHRITDRLSSQSAQNHPIGFAGIAAFEHKFLWSDVLGKRVPKALGVAGSLYGSIAVAHGAMGYLGAPYFATDYVVDNRGGLHLSDGMTAMLSFENIWSPTVKGNVTLSYFRSSFGAASTIPYSSLSSITGGVNFAQRFVTSGLRLSVGLEKLLPNGSRVGIDVGQNWTRSQGAVNGLSIAPLSSHFPDMMVYVAIPL
ncbi:MAG: porin [Paracoccaceae bacterium]|nr:porin [Paracoccaceae bacterium]